jgi:phosphatidylinositol-3-phosphatase
MSRFRHRHLVVPAAVGVLVVLVAAGVAVGALLGSADSSPSGSHAVHQSTSSTRPSGPQPPSSTLGWSNPATGSGVSAPCGSASGAPSRIAHVIVLVLENHSYGQIIAAPGSPVAKQAPFLNSIARRCGLATHYRPLTHPSLPNYLAITGGSTFGLARDVNNQVSGPSIFSALDAVHGSWAVYAEDMPSPCAPHRTSAIGYTPHHNPMLSYAGLNADCQAHDLPLGTITAGPLADALRTMTLPNYSFIAPSLGHDMHTGSIPTADRWVRHWVTAILHSPTYQHQSTVIFITVDEGTGGHIGKGEICSAFPSDQSCHVPLLVISRYVQPGTRFTSIVTHYSLLRTTADLLGVHAPGAGAHAPSLRTPFGL